MNDWMFVTLSAVEVLLAMSWSPPDWSDEIPSQLWKCPWAEALLIEVMRYPLSCGSVTVHELKPSWLKWWDTLWAVEVLLSMSWSPPDWSDEIPSELWKCYCPWAEALLIEVMRYPLSCGSVTVHELKPSWLKWWDTLWAVEVLLSMSWSPPDWSDEIPSQLWKCPWAEALLIEVMRYPLSCGSVHELKPSWLKWWDTLWAVEVLLSMSWSPPDWSDEIPSELWKCYCPWAEALLIEVMRYPLSCGSVTVHELKPSWLKWWDTLSAVEVLLSMSWSPPDWSDEIPSQLWKCYCPWAEALLIEVMRYPLSCGSVTVHELKPSWLKWWDTLWAVEVLLSMSWSPPDWSDEIPTELWKCYCPWAEALLIEVMRYPLSCGSVTVHELKPSWLKWWDTLSAVEVSMSWSPPDWSDEIPSQLWKCPWAEALLIEVMRYPLSCRSVTVHELKPSWLKWWDTLWAVEVLLSMSWSPPDWSDEIPSQLWKCYCPWAEALLIEVMRYPLSCGSVTVHELKPSWLKWWDTLSAVEVLLSMSWSPPDWSDEILGWQLVYFALPGIFCRGAGELHCLVYFVEERESCIAWYIL